MNPRHETNFWLWTACAAIVYCLLMAVPLAGKGPSHVGILWLAVFSHLGHPDSVGLLLYFVGGLGAVATVLGWVAHAILLVFHGILFDRRSALESNPGASE